MGKKTKGKQNKKQHKIKRGNVKKEDRGRSGGERERGENLSPFR